MPPLTTVSGFFRSAFPLSPILDRTCQGLETMTRLLPLLRLDVTAPFIETTILIPVREKPKMSTRFEPRWLNTDEAAQYLNVFPSAISRLVKAGLIRLQASTVIYSIDTR
jgi:hypothetical protein